MATVTATPPTTTPAGKETPPVKVVVAHAADASTPWPVDPNLPVKNPDIPKGEGEAYGDRG